MNKESLKKITKFRLFWPIVCLFVVLIVNLIRTPSFFNISINSNGVLYGYLIDIINRSSELIILAVGMTICVASSAGTDISVGAVMAITGAVTCSLLGTGGTYNMPYIAAVMAGILVATICGVWNGFLVAKLKIQPMVATLILFTAGRGIAQLITGGNILYIKVKNFKYLGSVLPGVPIPTPVFAAIAVVILTSLLLKKSALGMYIESVGINSKASRLIGLNSTFIIFLTYAFCGLCAGIAGSIATSRIYSIDANNVGLYMEMDAILAVALGGNSLAGGRFSLAGSVIGAITIQALSTSLYSMGVSADQLPVYKAIVVIIIVVLQSPQFKKFFRNFRKKVEISGAGEKVTQ
ncbi:MAG TPA: ABC transporter permease [Ruminiclostridium sp.]|nr:ABC transporter permease [Ruminiclostridium sp.]